MQSLIGFVKRDTFPHSLGGPPQRLIEFRRRHEKSQRGKWRKLYMPLITSDDGMAPRAAKTFQRDRAGFGGYGFNDLFELGRDLRRQRPTAQQTIGCCQFVANSA